MFIFVNIMPPARKKKKTKRRLVSFEANVVVRAESLMKPTESICGFFTQLLIDKYGPSDSAPGRIGK